ncbi:hypothetical protein MYX76_00945 [Desulfobacterota bacterium AH_259_B03_O07]|nr:hypothetical protein [Desulfobacterota bacterium AH_259_B03_O07]
MLTSFQANDIFDTTYTQDTLKTNAQYDKAIYGKALEQVTDINERIEPFLKGTLKESNESFTIEIKDFPDPAAEQIKSSIHAIKLPNKWVKEGIKPPNFLSKEIAEQIAVYIYTTFHLFPNRVSASIEEGVFLNYRNFNKEKDLSLEVYNDLEIAAIINQNDKILKTFDIKSKDPEIYSQIIKSFYE